MAQTYPTLPQCAVAATALKVLLFPAYKSTDFEVHRNWLAITHSLPLPKWYYEKTSEWTLDYPPFFAYFEYALSWAAKYVDPTMLQIRALGYDSWNTTAFQRSTVIASEFVLFFALMLFIESAVSGERKRAQVVAISILLSPGLLIIDHIHFQYNGFLYGILVLSLALMRFENGKLASGITFAALLCFKHIYLYLAPAYFVYLLRGYCLSPRSIFKPQFGNALKLGVGVVLVFAAAFGPYWYLGQLDQVMKRLFPFSRGLCHAYWAPNVWALYSFTDRLLIQVLPRIPALDYKIKQTALKSVTRGLVGDTSFAVLPEITPQITFILTLASQIIPLIKLFFNPSWDMFMGAITLCGYASFLFGWHVHEKAILLVIIPFSLVALKDRRYLGAFRPLAVAGHLSLFPLLFTTGEWLVKVTYTVAWLLVFLFAFDQLTPAAARPRIFVLDRLALAYTVFTIPVIVYCSLIHPMLASRAASAKQYEFLPLMFTSAYCALGVVGSWVGFLVVYFTS